MKLTKFQRSDINILVINVNTNIKTVNVLADGHTLANFMTNSKN